MGEKAMVAIQQYALRAFQYQVPGRGRAIPVRRRGAKTQGEFVAVARQGDFIYIIQVLPFCFHLRRRILCEEFVGLLAVVISNGSYQALRGLKGTTMVHAQAGNIASFGVEHGLAHAPSATTVTIAGAGDFAHAIDDSVIGRDDEALLMDFKPLQGITDAFFAQSRGFSQKGGRIDAHVPGKMRARSRDEAGGSELREDVGATVGRRYLMGRLGTAIVAHDGPGARFPGEVVDRGALALIAEGKTDYDVNRSQITGAKSLRARSVAYFVAELGSQAPGTAAAIHAPVSG